MQLICCVSLVAKSASLTLGFLIYNMGIGTSLVVQWLRICLPMQGTQVQALVREDPICRGANKPVRHNC